MGNGTAAQTQTRRQLLYALLGVEESPLSCKLTFHRIFTEFPEFTISEKSKTFEDWLDEGEQESAGFYWPRYKKYLQEVEGWPASSTAALKRATAGVLEVIARPSRQSVYQSRGLVVGFVQSGKTANFTGVIARAVDAGYRLIVILAGDKHFARADSAPFRQAADRQGGTLGFGWCGRRIPRGPRLAALHQLRSHPKELGACDWVRLTNLKADYKRLGTGPGLAALGV